IVLATGLLTVRIVMLRAEHLRVLPADDFVSLRALGVISRLAGEVVLVYCIGSGLADLLQPVGQFWNEALNNVAPGMSQKASPGSARAVLLTVPFTAFMVWFSAAFFVTTSSLATAIEVYLAIEFNTRAGWRKS